MAQVTARKPATVATKVAARPAARPATANRPLDGFKVVSIESIEFPASSRGGGKPMDPAVAKLIDKALTLQIGQGITIPVSLREERKIVSENGNESILYTFRGAQSLSKRAKTHGVRFRTRRDVHDNLWLFSVTPYTEEQLAAQEERRLARAAAKA